MRGILFFTGGETGWAASWGHVDDDGAARFPHVSTVDSAPYW